MPQKLRAWLSTEEIEHSPYLQTVFWSLFVGFFLSFDEWISSPAVLISNFQRGFHVCPPYFLNCGEYYFFEGWPNSYGQAIFYSALSGCLILSAAMALRKNWLAAQLWMAIPTLWKLVYFGLLTLQTHMNFEYFHAPVTLAFLFFPAKAILTRVVFVMVYLMAATVKFDDAWIAGTYFSSLKLGMPLVPDAVIPWVSNAVVLFEIFSPYLLFSRNRRTRWTALGLWTSFHLYSIIIVNFRYPAYCLPVLWALFAPDPPLFSPGWRKAVPGALVVGLMLGLGAIYHLAGDDPFNSRTKKLGVAMLDANRQCTMSVVPYGPEGARPEMRLESSAAALRCDPYRYWFIIQHNCKTKGLQRVAWSMNVSINGEPFYEIIKNDNACELTFNSWRGNPWILTPEQGAPLSGYPRKNATLKKSVGAEQIVFSEPQFEISRLQQWLKHRVGAISAFYWMLFWLWPLVLAFRFSRSCCEDENA
jgi:hypothetical protein